MNKKNRKIIYLAVFLFSISIALVSYINSSFLERFINEDYVGLTFTAASIFTILVLLEVPKLLNKFGNRKTVLYSLFLMFTCFILLATGTTALVVIPAFILYFVLMWLILSLLDIFFEDFSSEGSVGSFRGMYLMILNSAWVISQLISGTVINKTSFQGIYLLSSGFIVMVIIVFLFNLRNFKDPKYVKISIWRTFKLFMNNKRTSKIYFSNLILRFFYATMVIYTPIYLYEHLGFTWDKIGIIFSIMLLPFVILDLPLGKLSDKIGEKKMLNIGFSIIAVFVLLIPFVNEVNLFIWAGILFFTRVGAATVETMNEAYFFKVVNEKEANDISFYRNASAIAYIITPIIISAFLLISPSFKYLFLVLFFVLVLGFINSLKIQDVR